MDTSRLLTILVEAGSFIAAFAAIAAGIIMAGLQKRFGTGILALDFKSIAVGVFFIAGGMLLDAVQSYLQIANSLVSITVLLLLKELLFVIGTYIIVIASKRTGDKLESLTK